MNRKQGFYWVRIHDEWEIANYDEFDNWWLTGSEFSYKEHELKEIDERIIERIAAHAK